MVFFFNTLSKAMLGEGCIEISNRFSSVDMLDQYLISISENTCPNFRNVKGKVGKSFLFSPNGALSDGHRHIK